jgi:hypothetical protein
VAKNRYVEQKFMIKCRGRDNNGKHVLVRPIDVTVNVYQHFGNEKDIHTLPNCPYACGGHSDRCSAAGYAHRGWCVYSCDIPYCLEKKRSE